jgi:transposase
VLVMDNLRPHKTAEVQAVLDGSGFPYRYLPSYSPDFSPIEPGWAKVKSYLRRVAARTVETLQQALAPALDSITAQDAYLLISPGLVQVGMRTDFPCRTILMA